MKRFMIIILLIIVATFCSFSVYASAELNHILTHNATLQEDELYTFEAIEVNDVFQLTFTTSITGNFVFETYGDIDTEIVYGGQSYTSNTGYGHNEIIGFMNSGTQTHTFNVEINAIYGVAAVFVQVRRQAFAVYAIQDPIGSFSPIDTTGNLTVVNNLYNGVHDNMFDVHYHLNFTLAEIQDTLDQGLIAFNSEYVVYASHGSPGHYSYKDGTSYVHIPSTTLPDMSNTKLAIWSACYSGSSAPNPAKPWLTLPSVAESAFLKGARISIGWTGVLAPERVEYFNEYLLNALIGNTTETIADLVEEAAQSASANVQIGDDFITEYVIYGNAQAILNLSDATPNSKASTANFIPKDDLASPNAPSVVTGSISKRSAAFTITNNSPRYLILYAEHSDTTPDVMIKLLAPYEVYTHNFTGLCSSCGYHFYFQTKDFYRPLMVSPIVEMIVVTAGGGVIIWS